MNNLSKTSKFFLVITFIASILWVGIVISKYIVIYELFDSPSFNLKKEYLNLNLIPILRSIANLTLVHMIIYPVLMLFFILFIIFSKMKLKREGWLFIITVLFLLTIPFEIYGMTLDYNFIEGIFINNESQQIITGHLVKSVDLTGGISLMEIFAFITCIILFLLQPYRKPE